MSTTKLHDETRAEKDLIDTCLGVPVPHVWLNASGNTLLHYTYVC